MAHSSSSSEVAPLTPIAPKRRLPSQSEHRPRLQLPLPDRMPRHPDLMASTSPRKAVLVDDKVEKKFWGFWIARSG